jgi:hypothetical protein
MQMAAFPFFFTNHRGSLRGALRGGLLGASTLVACAASGASAPSQVPRASARVFPLGDSLLCKLPYAPGTPESLTPKPRLVLVEGVSTETPLVSFYGHQILALERQAMPKGGGPSVFFDAPESKYLFMLDQERLRLVVALKTKENEVGRQPRRNEGVAGNCSPL